MIDKLEKFYLDKPEPVQSALLFLKDLILKMDEDVNQGLSYGMPAFYFKKKRICYLWTDKKTGEPYILFVDGDKLSHPLLEQGNRGKMKILNVNSSKDIPKTEIEKVLKKAISLVSD